MNYIPWILEGTKVLGYVAPRCSSVATGISANERAWAYMKNIKHWTEANLGA
jgi:hypothetical protein